MKTEAKAWAGLAEESFILLRLLARRRFVRSTNLVCFHSNQCIAKYLKARLTNEGKMIQRVKQLTDLLPMILPLQPSVARFTSTMKKLNGESKFCYPGHIATRSDAREALKACRSIRAEVRASLGLPKK